MADEEKSEKKEETFGTGSLKGGEYEVEDVFEGAEPWSTAETKLVLWSFGVAAIVLLIGGILVNKYILH